MLQISSVLVKGITSKRVGAGVGLAVDPVVDPNDGLVIGPSTVQKMIGYSRWIQ